MLIVHFSLTPLAGSPIRICHALNQVAGVEARFVVLDPKGYVDRAHPTDLVWGQDKAAVRQLVDRADVLHLHNYVNLETTEFDPINFADLWARAKPMVRHFHSTPELVARTTGCDPETVISCPIPKLTIAQYPERFYAASRLVPNIVLPDQYGLARREREGALRIGYSPSNFRSARASRWDTKGYPETIRVLKKFAKTARGQGLNFEIDIIEQVSHRECLARKAECDIAIDDLVTGSYHMSTLESLALGSMVLTFMDDRVQKAAATVCGRDDFPALNVRLEDLEHVLLALLRNPDTVREIGRHSRDWMELHWSAPRMAEQFLDIYREVIANPHQSFSPRFGLQSPAEKMLNQGIHDLNWRARHTRWPKEPPLAVKRARSLLKKVGRILR